MWIAHYKNGNTINELKQPEFIELENTEDITSMQIFKEGTFFTVSRLNNSHRLIMQKVGVALLDPVSGEQSQRQTGHLVYCIHSPMGDAEGWLLDWANGVIQRIYFNVYQRVFNFKAFKVDNKKIRFGARPNLTITNFRQIIPHKEWEEEVEDTFKDEEGKEVKKKVTATFVEPIDYWECNVCHQFTAYLNDVCLYCGTPRKEEEQVIPEKVKKRIK